MGKKVLVISTSLRKGKSDLLADAFIKGAEEAGHEVEKINLIDKKIQFCKGCLVCQNTKTGHCVMKDDADMIVNKMKDAEVIAFATPIYFYEMSGQMKTLLDRSNPLFPVDYKFRDIYLITAAAEADKSAMHGAIKGLQGWIECFENTELKGVIYGNDSEDNEKESNFNFILEEAAAMGKGIL